MPLMNLNPGARARHQIRVITVGFFRMLKSMVDYKVRMCAKKDPEKKNPSGCQRKKKI